MRRRRIAVNPPSPPHIRGTLESAGFRGALQLLPRYVAERTNVNRVSEVEIP